MKIQDQTLDDVLVQLRARFNDDLPHFTDCVKKAFAAVDAVFWRERYLDFYWRCVTTVPGYIQEVVLANADAESAGSEGLFKLWASVHNSPDVEMGIEKHFRDESRHARLFVHLMELAFPEYCTPSENEQRKHRLFDASRVARVKSDAPASTPVLLDNLVQMNVGEIRTRAHMFMIGPVLTAFTPSDHKERVDGILSGLVYDEVSHIGYTACLMEEWCRYGHKRLIEQLYTRRLFDFNVYTVEQTRRSVELFGHGEYPDLLEI